MARNIFFFPKKQSEVKTFEARLEIGNPNFLRIAGETDANEFFGSFSRDSQGRIDGTIRRFDDIDIDENGQSIVQSRLTGLNVELSELTRISEKGGALAVNRRLLSESDDVTLSSGDDEYNGFNGDDLIRGFGGEDTIIGGLGDDRILGGQGADRLSGGIGDDTIKGGRSDDKLFGNAGNDRLSGQVGSDRIKGGAGNDRLAGQAGDDKLVGGGGNDTLNAGSGNDTLKGGTGEDVFNFVSVFGTNIITDFRDGDVIKMDRSLSYDDLLISPDGEDVTIALEGNSIVLRGVEFVSIDASDFLF